MKRKIGILVFITFTICVFNNEQLTSAREIKLSSGNLNHKSSVSFDFVLFMVDETSYQQSKEALQKLIGDTWKTFYIKSEMKLLFTRIKKEGDIKTKRTDASRLENQLNHLFGVEAGSIVWGFSLQDADQTILFPSGKIYILFNKKLSINDRKKILSPFKDCTIRYCNDIKIKQPAYRQTYFQDDTFVPVYVRSGIKHGIKQPVIYSRDAKDKVISSPFAIMMLPSGREKETFNIAEKLLAIKGVELATPDFHALGRNLMKLQDTSSPPPLDVNCIQSKNFIGRAWELFYPLRNAYDHLFPEKFLCSDLRTAVFDMNFHDHNYIRYDFSGFDSIDNDSDPRSPIYPYGLDVHDTTYIHGLAMCGIIGGIYQTDGWQSGVAPGATIVPFRAGAVVTVDLSTQEGTMQFVEDYAGGWWNALFRLWMLRSNEGVTVANFSGLSNELIFEATGLDAWMDWFLHGGNPSTWIFFSCSSGNNPSSSDVSFPACLDSTFAVGCGNFNTSEVQGNHGPKLDITVDDGRYPWYYPGRDHIYYRSQGMGGTSVASAVVSGTATLMRKAGSNMIDNGDAISTILKYSARFSRAQLMAVDANGFHNEFGYGFLDAFHATKIAYKDFMPPLKAQKIRFLPDGSSCLLINAGFPSYAVNYPNHSSGLFWCLKQATDEQGLYWKHLRLNPNTKHCEIVLDPVSPMGTSLVGDFDGDGFDEIALQLGYWADNPEYYFIVRKFNQALSDWVDLGQTTGTFPEVQFVLPGIRNVSQVVSARLTSKKKTDIVALQGNYLNAMEYDEVNNVWKPLGNQNVNLSLLAESLRNELDATSITGLRVKKSQIYPFINYRKQQTLLLLTLIEKTGGQDVPGRYIVASILYFNQNTRRFEYIPIRDSNKTQVIVSKTLNNNFPEVRIDDFDGDNDAEGVLNIPLVHGLLNFDNLIFLDVQRRMAGISETISLRAYPSHYADVPKIIESGDVNGDGHAELAFLFGNGNNNVVRFLNWDIATHTWIENLLNLPLNRRNNRATKLLIGDFNSDGIAEIGMLLEKPYNNIFAVYQMQNGSFQEFGYW